MIAIIGGTGLSEFSAFNLESVHRIATPYGNEEVLLSRGQLQGRELCFLPRHGSGHRVPPHRINYRANIHALHSLGIRGVIAVNAVGGIHSRMGPGMLSVPLQLIDYTWGRRHSFFEDGLEAVSHVDFSDPYDQALRQALLAGAKAGGLDVWDGGVYGCTQGPRLETAAEIRRLQRDGCDMVGMTAMPEAALARELDIAYASVALSVNWAAGLSEDLITMEGIREVLQQGVGNILQLIEATLPNVQS